MLLAKNGTLQDLKRNGIELQEGLALSAYSDDADDEAKRDDLVADGVVRYDPATVRWVLEIDWNAIKHESELGEDNAAG